MGESLEATQHGNLAGLDPTELLAIIVLADGYTPDASGRGQFESDWDVVWSELTKVTPFNHLRRSPNNLLVYLWSSATTASPIGHSYDTSSSPTLVVDPADVTAVLDELDLAAVGDGASDIGVLDGLAFPGTSAAGPTTTLVVVLAPNPGGDGSHGENTTVDDPYFVAIHEGPKAHLALAKALGRALGLGDEVTDDLLMPSWAGSLPGPNVKHWIDGTPSVEDLGWSEFEYVYDGPHEGGLGRTTSVYRFANHSIMGLPIGRPDLWDVRDELGFCEISEAYLEELLGDGRIANMSSRRTIRSQTLVYDEAGFRDLVDLPDTTTTTHVTTVSPFTDWWEFDLETGPSFGIRIKNLLIKTPDPMGSGHIDQRVAESLEFVDLQVSFGTTYVDVDLSLAVAPLVIQQGSRPRDSTFQEGVKLTALVPCGTAPQKVLLRVELAIAFRGPNADFDPPGAIEAAMFWPQYAMTVVDPRTVPSLDLSQFTGSITEARGEVRAVVNIDTPPAIQTMLKTMLGSYAGTMPSVPTNYISGFTDMHNGVSNMLELLKQLSWSALASLVASGSSSSRGSRFASLMASGDEVFHASTAAWVGIFDWVRLDVTEPISTPAAYSSIPGTTKGTSTRTDSVDVPWPGSSLGSFNKTITKRPRQAAYDNMHIHGTMGTVGGSASTRQRVMAPGCGHSCFHVHWRWGTTTYWTSGLYLPSGLVDFTLQLLITGLLDVIQNFSGVVGTTEEDWVRLGEQLAIDLAPTSFVLKNNYKGWSTTGTPTANAVMGNPLVPPNQFLEVDIEQPPPESGWVGGGRTLATDKKTFRYRPTMFFDNKVARATDRHVTFEHGAGIALRYPPSAADWLFRLNVLLQGCYELLVVGTLHVASTVADLLKFLPQPALNHLAALAGIPPMFSAFRSHPPGRAFTQGYDIILFLSRVPNPIVDAVADGTTVCKTSGLTIEEL